MKHRYNDYSMEQLREEVERLKTKVSIAEDLGEVNKIAIHKRKIQIVLSYMLNPGDFKPGDIYKLNGDPGHTFKITKINGMMAWGHKVNLLGELYEGEEAFPISVLGDKQEGV